MKSRSRLFFLFLISVAAATMLPKKLFANDCLRETKILAREYRHLIRQHQNHLLAALEMEYQVKSKIGDQLIEYVYGDRSFISVAAAIKKSLRKKNRGPYKIELIANYEDESVITNFCDPQNNCWSLEWTNEASFIEQIESQSEIPTWDLYYEERVPSECSPQSDASLNSGF